MVDLEDRGSEWPDLDRISKGSGIVSSACEALLTALTEAGYVVTHGNVDADSRFAITPEGRLRLFSEG